METIYLDNAATTPLAPEVLAVVRPLLEVEFGNPSSRHPLGVRAREAVDAARRQVARALGADPRRVVFTAGGTEANNLAVLGLARAARAGRHVLVGATEHPCVARSAEQLGREGFEVETLRLTQTGALDLEDLAARLRADTALVSVMAANNEVGTCYPIRQVGRIVRERAPEALVVTDAVQAFGKLELDLEELGVDALAVSAHKVHGPKGVGALVLARDLALEPLIHGGGQEDGLRSGTENVAGIAGFGRAAELADQRLEETRAVTAACREVLRTGLAELAGARLFEPGADQLPPIPSIAPVLLPGAPAEVWMHHLESRGVLVSAGSACHSARSKASPALLALGLDPDAARSVLRFSFAHGTTPASVERAVSILIEVGRRLESVSA